MTPQPDAVRTQLDRVLASQTFVPAGRLSRFLRFVVERTLAGEGDRLKEYVIGIDVFDRDEGYDPRLDSIVRVEAGRLRAKLGEYYQQDGRADPVIIRMRRGSYLPTFEVREDPVAPPEALSAAGQSHAPGWRIAAGLAAVVLVLALVAWRAGLWATSPVPLVSVAVLPFASYSTDPTEQMLAARITDGVTTDLARSSTVSVVSRTSAAQFTRSAVSLRELAQALNADVVLESTLQLEGEHIRVSTRLVDGTRDRKIWVGDFTGTRGDVADLERRIATAVATAARTRNREP